MKITISTGKYRKETRWKIKTIEWSRLVEKLSHTVRTPETQAEYRAANKDRKAEIKDVGGFVGGAVEGGRRVKGSVKTRSLVTLDMDYATRDIWDDITLNYSCMMCMYSTHSHTSDNPRYRLIIPLDREVNPDEYEAIARKVAETIGIDLFDDSTYQCERLMYWSSTPKDGEFVFEQQDGDPLCADEVLAEYRDWKDISQWATSSRVNAVIRKQMKKKGEPTERPGIVGLFCRAYTITEAIDAYLSDVYQPVANGDARYTYMNGTSSGGLVVYEDKFAFSHHATDPASEQMCNAFDLVRVHLFGDMDNDVSENVPINKRPSFIEMEKLAGKDAKVKAEQRSGIEQQLQNDFGDIYDTIEDDEVYDDKWIDKLERDGNFNVKSNVRNVLLILENDRGLKNNLRRNDFDHKDYINHSLPWRNITATLRKEWGNDDDARLRVYLENYYGIKGKDMILNCFVEVTTSHRYHPIRDYLSALNWDGTERVETLLIDYLGADDCMLTRTITRKFLAAAVARVFRPGCKFDYVTVLQGEEGIGKSTLIRKIAGEEWFSDSLSDMSGKEAMETLQGSWIIEIGELNAIKRSEVESVKAFVSRQVDAYRPAYGRTREDHARQCIFFATTNEQAFLKGYNGNRRFWVVPCNAEHPKSAFDIDDETRNQIWAEAVEIYKNGEPLFLSKELEREMRNRQEEYNELSQDVRIGMIQDFLDKKLPPDWTQMSADQKVVYLADEEAIEQRGTYLRDKVCVAEVLVECLHERIDEKTRYRANEITALLSRIKGWERYPKTMRFEGYGTQKGFIRIKDDKA